jgi:AcrR family transcriptional regulator
MPAKRRYHHGNLKQVLLDSAVALIAEVGFQAFTLRELARRAGVSHNAPYRHFEDKEDLLGAVAAQGFDRLTASMTEAMAGGRTAVERLRLAGQGYVKFALSWPQHIVVMFETPASHELRPEYETAAHRAFQYKLKAVCRQATRTPSPSPPGRPCTGLPNWPMEAACLSTPRKQ